MTLVHLKRPPPLSRQKKHEQHAGKAVKERLQRIRKDFILLVLYSIHYLRASGLTELEKMHTPPLGPDRELQFDASAGVVAVSSRF